ncbi:uncharacterized protein G2W53_038195 [Senna tora]|uniref:Uncharacterized protein n=1 Tax=Senna tora TaxID=362788 RepID=A0A834SLD6_9FABA|nr:uncharacterized protein G2W53_038195 [Senna tora]
MPMVAPLPKGCYVSGVLAGVLQMASATNITLKFFGKPDLKDKHTFYFNSFAFCSS